MNNCPRNPLTDEPRCFVVSPPGEPERRFCAYCGTRFDNDYKGVWFGLLMVIALAGFIIVALNEEKSQYRQSDYNSGEYKNLTRFKPLN